MSGSRKYSMGLLGHDPTDWIGAPNFDENQCDGTLEDISSNRGANYARKYHSQRAFGRNDGRNVHSRLMGYSSSSAEHHAGYEARSSVKQSEDSPIGKRFDSSHDVRAKNGDGRSALRSDNDDIEEKISIGDKETRRLLSKLSTCTKPNSKKLALKLVSALLCDEEEDDSEMEDPPIKTRRMSDFNNRDKELSLSKAPLLRDSRHTSGSNEQTDYYTQNAASGHSSNTTPSRFGNWANNSMTDFDSRSSSITSGYSQYGSSGSQASMGSTVPNRFGQYSNYSSQSSFGSTDICSSNYGPYGNHVMQAGYDRQSIYPKRGGYGATVSSDAGINFVTAPKQLKHSRELPTGIEAAVWTSVFRSEHSGPVINRIDTWKNVAGNPSNTFSHLKPDLRQRLLPNKMPLSRKEKMRQRYRNNKRLAEKYSQRGIGGANGVEEHDLTGEEETSKELLDVEPQFEPSTSTEIEMTDCDPDVPAKMCVNKSDDIMIIEESDSTNETPEVLIEEISSVVEPAGEKQSSIEENEKVFCHICDIKSFQTLSLYWQHLKSPAHQEVSKAYYFRCNAQLQLLQASSSLAAVRTKFGDNSTSHLKDENICVPCNLRYSGKMDVHNLSQEHKLVQSYVTFKCCGQSYDTGYSLEKHRLSLQHHRRMAEADKLKMNKWKSVAMSATNDDLKCEVSECDEIVNVGNVLTLADLPAYNPDVPISITSVLKMTVTEYFCTLCQVEVATPALLDTHCRMPLHYDNLQKKLRVEHLNRLSEEKEVKCMKNIASTSSAESAKDGTNDDGIKIKHLHANDDMMDDSDEEEVGGEVAALEDETEFRNDWDENEVKGSKLEIKFKGILKNSLQEINLEEEVQEINLEEEIQEIDLEEGVHLVDTEAGCNLVDVDKENNDITVEVKERNSERQQKKSYLEVNKVNFGEEKGINSEKTENYSEEIEINSKESEINSNETEIYSEETDINSKETEIYSKETEIYSKETDINSKETDIDSKETEINSEETDIDSKETEINSEETDIDSKETEINSEETDIDSKETEIIPEETDVTSKETEINSDETEINSEETDVDSKETDINSKETEINSEETDIYLDKKCH